MKAFLNLAAFIVDHWCTIVLLIGMIVTLVYDITEFMKKSDEEKIRVAKKQIVEIMLKLVSNAENQYKHYEKAGAIKRSTVIEYIYAKYPILNKVVNQEEIISFIDENIDKSLKTLRSIIELNESNID